MMVHQYEQMFRQLPGGHSGFITPQFFKQHFQMNYVSILSTTIKQIVRLAKSVREKVQGDVYSFAQFLIVSAMCEQSKRGVAIPEEIPPTLKMQAESLFKTFNRVHIDPRSALADRVREQQEQIEQQMAI